MKEATGELNMTVVVVIIVAALVAFFSMVVWPLLNTNLKYNAGCSEAICDYCSSNETWCWCHLSGDSTNKFKCANRG